MDEISLIIYTFNIQLDGCSSFTSLSLCVSAPFRLFLSFLQMRRMIAPRFNLMRYIMIEATTILSSIH